jgi:hypothetical protein
VASQGHTIDEALVGVGEASSCRPVGELARWLPHGLTHVTADAGGLFASASITGGRRTLVI